MPRLFTGLELPSGAVAALTGLRGGLPGARWIDPENYHLTLRFVGDVDNRTAHSVAEILDRIQRPAFSITLDGIGAFGGRKPHSVFAAVQSSPQLSALQAEQERLMQMLGLPPDSRKFAPHVTVARLRGVQPASVASYIEARGGFYWGPIAIERFVLFSSRSGQGGGPYVVEETYPLQGSYGSDEDPERD
ncbi:RNA 2',3'-cyclic phosphodiesterase [Microbaculum marinum]|uniref:RNA 2',3'-cyclic phosphodiesterase n=1 Tax=Microbaculum marinum TaxID=1764581 RepID=A0AAW9RSE9_9HYPH